MAKAELILGEIGGSSDTPLTTVYNQKNTVISSFQDSGQSASGTRLVALIGALDSWCVYSVDNGTLTRLATGANPTYYEIQIGTNGNFEYKAINNSTTPWFLILA